MPEGGSCSDCIAMDSMLRANSLGSCDSVVSTNSAFSDDSYDYLSAEEKACLLFLEETIESLDTEADSGVSTDENDRVEDSVVKSSVTVEHSSAAKVATYEDSVQNHEKPVPDLRNPANHIPGALVHPAFVPANERSVTSPKPERKSLSPTFEQKVQSRKLEWTSLSPKYEQKVLSSQCEQTSTTYEQKTPSKLEQTSPPISEQKTPSPQLKQATSSPKFGQKIVEAADITQQILITTKNVSGAYWENVSSQPHTVTSKGDNAKLMVPVQLPEKSPVQEKFILPPELVRDQSSIHNLADSSVSKTDQYLHSRNLSPECAGKILKTDSKFSGLTPGNLELLKQQAAQKRVPLEPPGQKEKSMRKADIRPLETPGQKEKSVRKADIPLSSSGNSLHAKKGSHIVPSVSPIVETADQKMKQGPPTAPKPKKLPSNIILKQGYQPPPPTTLEALEGVRLSGATVLQHADFNPFHSSGSFTERSTSLKPGISDQQARQEALKKLGLIRDVSRGTYLSPSTAKEEKPESAPFAKPLTPNPAIIKKSEISVDKSRSASQLNLAYKSVNDLVDGSLQLGAKPVHVKSFSLERSGPSLSSYIAANEHLESGLEKSRSRNSFVENFSPNFLRNSRPRTVSLGTKSDFSSLSVPPAETTGHEISELRQSLPSQISARRLSKHGTDVDPEPLQSLDGLRRTSTKKQEITATQTKVVASVSHNPFPQQISTKRLSNAPGNIQSIPRTTHSVQIAPLNSTHEHRTEALKKLGLFKEDTK